MIPIPQTLPLSPPHTVPIGDTGLSFSDEGDQRVYFSNLQVIDFHDVSDHASERLRMAKFAYRGVKLCDVAEAFGVHSSTVLRARRRFEEVGVAGWYEPQRARCRTVFDAKRVSEAERLLASGLSGNAAARRMGIDRATFHDNLRAGVIRAPQEARASARSRSVSSEASTGFSEASSSEPSDLSARDARDRTTPMGRATHDTSTRVLAATGRLPEAPVRFEAPRHGVRYAGVLAGLPMLLREGLLSRVGSFLSLPNGYYGLAPVLLLLAFMALARVRNPEALRHMSPGEWGGVLGLDRCPEVKTLRRKIKALAADLASVRGWQASLAADWLAEDPEAHATLYVDGHVKVYTGRKGRLPKHFVSRQKLCLPASTSYWIHALGGKPFLCLNKALDPTMTHALEKDVVPALERLGVLGDDPPDLTRDSGRDPELTLVFDREGWSPALFRRLARRGIAVITWHKNFKGEDWPEARFETVSVPIHGPGGVRHSDVRLAEDAVTLDAAGTVRVRQIRRLTDSGRQVPLITTHPTLPAAQAAGALFSRWCQENFFKYMREEFGLDDLAVRGLTEPDPEERVVNPPHRLLDRAVRRLRRRLGTLRNRIADLRRRASTAKAEKAIRRLEAEAEAMDTEREELKAARSETAPYVLAGELSEEERLHAIPEKEKLLLDIVRTVAYRAETRMTAAVASAQGKCPKPRAALQQLLSADADILPEPHNGVLRIRILGSANDATDAAIQPLLDELNETETVYPGSGLRLVYEQHRNG